jgi:hypothetical protein
VDLKPSRVHRTPNGACVRWNSRDEVVVQEPQAAPDAKPRLHTWYVRKLPNGLGFTDCGATQSLPTRNAVFELQDGVTRVGVQTDGRQITGVRVFPEGADLTDENLRGFTPAKDAYFIPNGCDKVLVGPVGNQ